MRAREILLAFAALAGALLLPLAREVAAAGGAAGGHEGATETIHLAGALQVGGKKVETSIYRSDERPELHLRRLLAHWRRAPVHIHSDVFEGGLSLSVIDVHGGRHWIYRIRGVGEGSETTRAVSSLLPEEAASPSLLDSIELPADIHVISHIRDRVLEREVETCVLASSLERAQIANALAEGLGLNPCEGASSHDPEGQGQEGGERLDAMGAGLRLCGVQEGVELQVSLGGEDRESWLLLRLAKGLP